MWYNNPDGAGLATPHTRGSTVYGEHQAAGHGGYPAYAGIDLLLARMALLGPGYPAYAGIDPSKAKG